MATLFFVDGYHGGIRGHMPTGSWQDILHALECWPSWKISLEIEPESWNYLKRHDYTVYQKLQQFVSAPETADRIEFISGSYAQPFCWAVTGESNIRQLMAGAALTKSHFPMICIDTYSVQEPCFTSSLPQILTQLGYRRMSLKNPTAWGGYMEKMNGSVIRLQSGDGSTIPAVPRYTCEELVGCNTTEGAGYDYSAIASYADKCQEHGVRAPVGMCLQDLGWSSAPLVQDMDVKYVTWREYFNRFGKTHGETVFSHQEDIHVALPWGNRILQEMLRNVRVQENRILQAEKLLAIAEIQQGRLLQEVRKDLGKAWESLMQAQHHDGFICATCGEETRQWAFQSNAYTAACNLLLDSVTDAAMDAMTVLPAHASGEEIWLRVYNTVGSQRESQAQVLLGLPCGTVDLQVVDETDAKIPCQYTVERNYADGTIGAATLRFKAAVPGIGCRVYKVIPAHVAALPVQGIAKRGIQDTIEVRTRRLKLSFDLKKGGAVVRFHDCATGRDYAKNLKGFGTLKGYFVEQAQFVDTGSTEVSCKILENGPLYCRLEFSGFCGKMSFRTAVSVEEDNPQVEFETAVSFNEDTEIGFPYVPKAQEAYDGTRRSSLREDYKLGVQLPLGDNKVQILKSAAYDVYESGIAETCCEDWKDIQHNIIHEYMDVYQKDTDTGMAVFCDSINGYALTEKTLALTVAFGYHANFWWGYQPARGTYRLQYSLLLHKGGFETAQIGTKAAMRREPLLVQRLAGEPVDYGHTVFCCDTPNVEVVTILPKEEKHQVRLFHSGSAVQSLVYCHSIPGFLGEAVDLQGRASAKPGDVIGKLEIKTLQ